MTLAYLVQHAEKEPLPGDPVTIVERNEEPAYAAFKCRDPDGHRIEVYWEPPPTR